MDATRLPLSRAGRATLTGTDVADLVAERVAEPVTGLKTGIQTQEVVMNSRELSHRLQSRSKLAAGFTDRTAAESAAEAIRTRLHDDASTVVIVAPGERDSDAFDRKVGARSGVVRDQLLVSHVVLGIGGALLGAIAMMVVLALVMEAPLDDPWLYPMIGAFFGAIAGLLLAGVWSLKPREGYLASRIADHARDGAWHVVVKAETSGDADRAEEIAGDRSRSVLKS